MGNITAVLQAWDDLNESEKEAFEAIINQQRHPPGELLTAEQIAELGMIQAKLDRGELEFATDVELQQFWSKYAE